MAAQEDPSPSPTERTKRTWRTWHLIVASGVALLLGIGIGSSDSKDETTVNASNERSRNNQTTTTIEPATTTTAAPTTTTTPPQPQEVLRVSGSSKQETGDFSTVGTWRVDWRIKGGAGVNVVLRNSAGERMDSFSTDPGESGSQFRQGCSRCYLELSPFGSTFEMWVTDVPG